MLALELREGVEDLANEVALGAFLIADPIGRQDPSTHEGNPCLGVPRDPRLAGNPIPLGDEKDAGAELSAGVNGLEHRGSGLDLFATREAVVREHLGEFDALRLAPLLEDEGVAVNAELLIVG